MREIRIKQGEALCLSLQFRSHEAPLDVGAMTLTAQVRDPADRLVANLVLEKQSTIGLVTIQALDTSQWPVGRLRSDLRVIENDVPLYSETFPISVSRRVTQS